MALVYWNAQQTGLESKSQETPSKMMETENSEKIRSKIQGRTDLASLTCDVDLDL